MNTPDDFPEPVRLFTPLADVSGLHAGDRVLLSGIIYTARDAAHKRLCERLAEGLPLPFDPRGAVIFYAGPTPTPPGRIIGSIGPTTSYRMDPYTPALYEAGIKATIGKGGRSPEVRGALIRCQSVYLVAVGGAAVLLAQTVRSVRIIAYDDLGPEAIRELTVVDFPCIVANDIHGGDIYTRL